MKYMRDSPSEGSRPLTGTGFAGLHWQRLLVGAVIAGLIVVGLLVFTARW